MFNKFDEETKKVLSVAKQEMFELKHPYLGSEHIMLGILKSENNISNILKKYKITYKKFKNYLIKITGIGDIDTKWVLYTPLVKEIFERATYISKDNNSKVTIEYLFTALIELGDGIATRVLNKLNLNIDKLYTEIIFQLPKTGSKKTQLLDEIGIEYTTQSMISNFDPVIGRESEINKIIEILIRKNKSNPLLIGDAGVGKSAIVEEISRLIVENKVPNQLRGKHIINIDMSSIVAGTKYRGEFEEKLNKIINELENNDDIILFIDEVHTLVGAGGAEGAIDASNIFKPALARGKIKFIGATTLDEYKKFIEKDKALDRRFKKVMVEEPSIDRVKDIIYKLKPVYEKYHQVSISNELIDYIIKLSNKYIYNYKNPDKTIDILDEVCAHANIKDNPNIRKYNELNSCLRRIKKEKYDKLINNNYKDAFKLRQKENEIITKINNLELYLASNYINKVTKRDVIDVIKGKINISGLFCNKNNLIKKLQQTVINQEKSIIHLVNDYFTNRKNDECYKVLITGSIGCGKTMLSEKFSKEISNNIIKINMVDYQEAHSISKIIGTSPGYIGYEETNLVFESIKEYPFSTIIIDNIEEAHPNVLNILYSIFSTSELVDSKGNKIKFNNCTFIINVTTSNSSKLGFSNNNINNTGLDNQLLDRMDTILYLNKLDLNSIKRIIQKECKGKAYDKFNVNEIVVKSDYEKVGAKKIKNLIKNLKNFKKIKKICKNYSKN